MKWFDFYEGRVGLGHCWTAAEVRREVEAVFETFGPRLPPPTSAVVIKPNLNNDVPALMGNSTDLRVLCALLEVLADRGHRDVTIADGPNVGMERREIDGFARLRIDRLARRHGARLIDINRSEGHPVSLETGPTQICRQVLDAPFLIAVPKLKTHAEAGLSMATKLWVGSVVAQHKRDVHVDLSRNIATLGSIVKPHLVLMDLLVGMEGNGPGDGTPFRMDSVAASLDPWLLDLVVARLAGQRWDSLEYLVHARDLGYFSPDLPDRIEPIVPIRRPIHPAPPRGFLAPLSEHRLLRPLKMMIRPIVDHPWISRAAYALGVIQDRYQRDDDRVTRFDRIDDVCTACGRCSDVCPDGIPREDIGTAERGEGCLRCLYCFWTCPSRAIELQGQLGYLESQIDRYKPMIEQL